MFSSPQHSPAMVLIPGQVKVLDHEGDVSVPGLVQAQDTHSELEIRFWAKGFYYPTVLPCIWRIHGDERLDLPGHYLFCPSHCESLINLKYWIYNTMIMCMELWYKTKEKMMIINGIFIDRVVARWKSILQQTDWLTGIELSNNFLFLKI